MFCIFTPISLYPLNLSTSKLMERKKYNEHGVTLKKAELDDANADGDVES